MKRKMIDVVRAWRDEEYRNSLTEEERAGLPENPAGVAVVSDSVLRSLSGGCGYTKGGCITSECYPGSTWAQSCVSYPEICP